MIDNILKLPDDVFRQHLIRYFTVFDLVWIDNASTNHLYRSSILSKLQDAILIGDLNMSVKISLLDWLIKRRIYLQNMKMTQIFGRIFSRSRMNNYLQHFNKIIYMLRYCSRLIIADSKMNNEYIQQLIVSEHCVELITFISTVYPNLHRYCTIENFHIRSIHSLILTCSRNINDHSVILLVAEHCYGLQTLNLTCCVLLTDISLIAISQHCISLRWLQLTGCPEFTDIGMISLSQNCTKIETWTITYCKHITDKTIISIAQHCVRSC